MSKELGHMKTRLTCRKGRKSLKLIQMLLLVVLMLKKTTRKLHKIKKHSQGATLIKFGM